MVQPNRLATTMPARPEPVVAAAAPPAAATAVPLRRVGTTRFARSGPVAVTATPAAAGTVVPLRRVGTTRFARSGPAPVQPASALVPDLLTSVYAALAADAGLAALFGRPASGNGGWLWKEVASSRYRLPVVVINDDDSGGVSSWAYDRASMETRSIRADVFAVSSSSPGVDELARAVRDHLIKVAGPIAWVNGVATDRVSRGSDPQRIETHFGPGGRRIQGRRVLLDFAVQFAPRG